MWYIRLIETGRVPDWAVRAAIRMGQAHSRRAQARQNLDVLSEEARALRRKLASGPISVHTQDANRQHYEVPTAFFQTVLGPWLKYSCCYWPQGVETLEQAEVAMLELTCQRAQIADGMAVLDLGCGWGALALWIATHYPRARVLAVSNSRTQRAYIEAQCVARGLANLEVLTADVADLQLDRQFDRVVSVEMFEHLKNYAAILARIATLLKPDGKLLVHVFSHRELAYEFDAADTGNWMAQTFFAGGTMPSDSLLLHYQHDLEVEDHWQLGGQHYARTLRAWLNRLDAQRDRVRELMAEAYGADQATRWLANWRLFFLACEETWAQCGGREYSISHYLSARR